MMNRLVANLFASFILVFICFIQPASAAPVFDQATTPQTIKLKEGTTRVLTILVTDPLGGVITLAGDRKMPGFITIVDHVMTIDAFWGSNGKAKFNLIATNSSGVSTSFKMSVKIKKDKKARKKARKNNNRPTMNGIPSRINMLEGTSLAFPFVVSDPDGDFPINVYLDTMNTNVPSWANIANGNILSISPPVGTAGNKYKFDVNVVDSKGLENTYTIDVRPQGTGGGAQPPMISRPGKVVMMETESIVMPILAFDPNGDTFVFSGDGNEPNWITFVGSEIRGTAPPGSRGQYKFNVIATDTTGQSSNEKIDITVNRFKNNPPNFGNLNNQTMMEGQSLSYQIPVSDPEGHQFTLAFRTNKMGTVPAWMTIDTATNTFIANPPFGASGTIRIELIAEDVFLSNNTDKFDLTVDPAPNNRPVFNMGDPVTVDEGTITAVPIIVSDPDGDAVTTIFRPGKQRWAFITMNGSDIMIEPGFNDAGVFRVELEATDARAKTQNFKFDVIVNDVNQTPVVSAVNAVSIYEGSSTQVVVNATDADGDNLSFSVGAGTPAWVTNNKEVVDIAPQFGDKGVYLITVVVSDGRGGNVIVDIPVTVLHQNRAPVFGTVPNVSLDEGTSKFIGVPVADPDLDTVTLTLGAGAPLWMSITNTGALKLVPNYESAGTYNISLNVDDGYGLTDTTTTTITVNNVNRGPSLAAITNVAMDQFQTANVIVKGVDPDADTLVYSTAGTMPGFASMVGDTITFAPILGDVGVFNFTVRATDPGGLFSEQSFQVTVGEVNVAPVIQPINNVTMDEGSTKNVTVIATDGNNDPLIYSFSFPKPTWANISGNSITLLPTFAMAGSHDVTIIANDGRGGRHAVTFTVDVLNVDLPPVVSFIPDVFVSEGGFISIPISVIEPDGEPFILNLKNNPGFCNINNGTLEINPGGGDKGNYQIIIRAEDPAGNRGEIRVNIIVDKNGTPPVIPVINPPAQVYEGAAGLVPLGITDPDGDAFTVTLDTGAPIWITYKNNTLITHAGFNDAGVYAVNITATDSRGLSSTGTIDIEVLNVNRIPIMGSVILPPVNDGATVTGSVFGSDLDGDTLTYTLVGQTPSWVTIIGTSLTISPPLGAIGPYTVTVVVTDPSGATGFRNVSGNVYRVNAAPIIDAVQPITLVEGTSTSTTITSNDPDGNNYSIYTNANFTWLTFDSITGLLSVNTVIGDSAIYFVPLRAIDEFGASTFYSVTVTITPAAPPTPNNPPLLGNISPNVTVTAGTTKAITLSATDPEGFATNFSVAGGKAWMLLTPTKSPASLTFTPALADVGIHTISVIANDNSLDSVPKNITINVVDGTITANNAPSIDPVANITLQAGTTNVTPIVVTDVEGDPTTVFVASGPAWATVAAGNTPADMTLAPASPDQGTYDVTLVANDGTTDSIPFIIRVIVTAPPASANQIPVVTSISDVPMDAGTTQNVNVIATDPESAQMTFSVTGPTWATITKSTIPGTLDLSPPLSDSGVFSISIIANDGVKDSAPMVFTVNVNAVNVNPTVTVMPSVLNITQGSTLSVPFVGTDANLDTLTYKLINSSVNWATINGNNIDLSPPVNEPVGTYSATIEANDGNGGTATAFLTIKVKALNHAPTIQAITSVTMNEGATQTVAVIGADIDGDNLNYTLITPPKWVSIIGATVTLAPDYTANGVHTINIQVDDGRGMSASTTVDVTVINVNRAPVIPVISPVTVNEGEIFNINVNPSDPDANSISLALVGSPPWASIYGTSIALKPGYQTSGNYTFTVAASDGNGGSVSTTVDVTVAYANAPPTMVFASPILINEADVVDYAVFLGDPNGDVVTISVAAAPAWVSVGGKGLILTPSYSDSGSYTFNMTATDPSGLFITKPITISVVNSNQPPVIAAPVPTTIAENSTASVILSATDVDVGDTITYGIVGAKPTWVSIVGNIIYLNPDYNSAGIYSINVQAVDSAGAVSVKAMLVTVTNVNRAPVVASIADVNMVGGTSLPVTIQASDPDFDILNISITNGPAWATNSNSKVILSPSIVDAGVFSVIVTASDGATSTSITFNVVVVTPNFPPVFTPVIGTQTVSELTLSSIPYFVKDDNGDTITLSIVSPPTPSFVSLEGLTIVSPSSPGATVSGTLGVAAGYLDSGLHQVTVRADDGKGGVTNHSFDLNVLNVNIQPILDVVADVSINEGVIHKIIVPASDQDNDPLSLTLDPGTPAWITTSGLQIVSSPGFNDMGSYPINFSISDGKGTPVAGAFNITVIDSNRPPTVQPISGQILYEGNPTQTIKVMASDLDGDVLAYSLGPGAPVWATIAGDTISMQPSFGDVGSYSISIIVDDGFGGVVTRVVGLTVNTVNRQPVLTPINDIMLNEGAILDLAVNAIDADGDPLIYSIKAPTPGFASIAGNIISFVPNHNNAGTYLVIVEVRDGKGGIDTGTFTVTVNDINRLPTIGMLPDQSVDEGLMLNVTASGADLDGDPLAYSMDLGAPIWASISGSMVTFVPDFKAAGVHPITLTVSDGRGGKASTTFNLTVNNINASPVVDPIANQTLSAGSNALVKIFAMDPEGSPMTYSLVNPPVWASVTGNVISLIPTVLGNITITARVTDFDGAIVDTSFVVNVNVSNNPPNFSQQNSISVDEGSTISVTLIASDIDGDTISFSHDSSVIWEAIAGNVLTLTPGFDAAGTHNLPISASDGRGGIVSRQIAVMVNDVNRAPVFIGVPPVPDVTLDEGTTQGFQAIASDPDGDPVSFAMAAGTPNWITVSPSTGSLQFSPRFTASGSYVVSLQAADPSGAIATTQFTVIVIDINLAPTLPPVTSVSMLGGESVALALNASDPDLDVLTYSLDPAAPAWASVANNVISLQPATLVGGDFPITVMINDGRGGTVSSTFTVTVLRSNSAPVFSSIPRLLVTELVPETYNAAAIDAEGDPVSYRFIGASPAWVSADLNGIITFNAPAGSSGVYSATLEANDLRGGVGTVTLEVVVTATPNSHPVAANPAGVVMSEGQTRTVPIPVVDNEADPLTYVLVTNQNWISIQGGSLVLAPGFMDDGTYVVSVDISDGRGGQASISFQVVVGNANRVPTINKIKRVVMHPGDTVDVQLLLSDPDNDPLILSMVGAPQYVTLNTANIALNQSSLHFSVPLNAAPAEYAFTVNVNDGFATTPMVVSFGITALTNNIPNFSTIDLYVRAGDIGKTVFAVKDIDGDPVTLSVISGPSWAHISNVGSNTTVDNGRKFVAYPPVTTPPGTYTTTFRASDGKGGVNIKSANIYVLAPAVKTVQVPTITTTTTTVPGNRPPVISPPGGSFKVSANGLTPSAPFTFDFSVSDPDGDAVGVVITNWWGTSGTLTNLGNNNYRITGTVPGVINADSYRIHVHACDTIACDIRVFTVNTPANGSFYKFLPNGPDKVVLRPGDYYAATPTYHKVTPSGLLSYDGLGSFVTGNNSWVYKSGANIVFAPPAWVAPGIYYADVIYSTTAVGVTLARRTVIDTIKIKILPFDIGPPTQTTTTTTTYTPEISANHAPYFVDVPPMHYVIPAGKTTTKVVSARDKDGDDVIVSLLSADSWVSISNNSVSGPIKKTLTTISFSPPTNTLAGWYTIALSAVDNHGANASLTMFYYVSNNEPPIIHPISNMALMPEDTIVVFPKAFDPEGEAITWSLPNAPAWVKLINGAVFVQPPAGVAGVYSATIRAIDASGGFSDHSWSIDVGGTGNGNHAPTIQPITDIIMNEGVVKVVPVITNDVDGDNVNLSLVSPTPNFVTITGSTINLEPGYADAGVYIITINADDGRGGSSISKFQVTVLDVNRPPVIDVPANITIDEDTTKTVTLTGNDPDPGDNITYSIVLATPWISIVTDPPVLPLTGGTQQPGTMTLSPPPGSVGTYSVIVKVTDAKGLVVTASFTVTVVKVESAVGLSASVSRAVFGKFKVDRILKKTLDSGATPVSADMACRPTGVEVCAPSSSTIDVCEYEENGECLKWISTCDILDVEMECVKSVALGADVSRERMAASYGMNVMNPNASVMNATSPYSTLSSTSTTTTTDMKQCRFVGTVTGDSNFRHRIYGIKRVPIKDKLVQNVHPMTLTNNSVTLLDGSFKNALFEIDGVTQIHNVAAASNGSVCTPGDLVLAESSSIFEGVINKFYANNHTHFTRVCESPGMGIKFEVRQNTSSDPTLAGCNIGAVTYTNIAVNPDSQPAVALTSTWSYSNKFNRTSTASSTTAQGPLSPNHLYGMSSSCGTLGGALKAGYVNECSGTYGEICTLVPSAAYHWSVGVTSDALAGQVKTKYAATVLLGTAINYELNHIAMTRADVLAEIGRNITALELKTGYSACVSNVNNANLTQVQIDVLNGFGGSLPVSISCDQITSRLKDVVELFSDDMNPVPSGCGTIDINVSPTPVAQPSGIIKGDPLNPLLYGCDPAIGYKPMCLDFWGGICHDVVQTTYCGQESMAYACGNIDYTEMGGMCPNECLIDLPPMLPNIASMGMPITTGSGCKPVAATCTSMTAKGCMDPVVDVEIMINKVSTVSTGVPTQVPTMSINQSIDPATDPNMSPLASSLGIAPGTAVIPADSAGSNTNIGNGATPFPVHTLPPSQTIDSANPSTHMITMDPTSLTSLAFAEAVSKFAIFNSVMNSVENSGGSTTAAGGRSPAQFMLQDIWKGSVLSCGKDLIFDYCNHPTRKPAMIENDAGKCVAFPRYCVADLLGVCINWESEFCCYSSRLNRSLVTQIKSQLGKTWGLSGARTCGGLVIDDLGAIDWDKLDLTELENSILPDAGFNAQTLIDKFGVGGAADINATDLTNKFMGGAGGQFTGGEMGGFSVGPNDLNVDPAGNVMNQFMINQSGGKRQGSQMPIGPATESPTLSTIPYQDLVPQ